MDWWVAEKPLHRSTNPIIHQSNKEGSALIIVLAVVVVLTFLVADFAADLNNELKAAGGYSSEAINFQLARSALALGHFELQNNRFYANGHGDAFLVSGAEDYETEIEELQIYRDGYELGQGLLAYRLVHTPSALDPNELQQNQWHRLFEVACGLEEGNERSELVDCILDWIDEDNIARASGMEEDDYQDLETPRHAKNGELDSMEELLLVNGITPTLFYGEGSAVGVDDGMLWGGGLLRYIMGDNSPEGRASAEYILNGTYSEETSYDEEEELEYKRIDSLPGQLYLIAEGFQREAVEEDRNGLFLKEAEPKKPYLSRRIILVRLILGKGENASYQIDDMLENAPREMVDRVLAYGIPESELDR